MGGEARKTENERGDCTWSSSCTFNAHGHTQFTIVRWACSHSAWRKHVTERHQITSVAFPWVETVARKGAVAVAWLCWRGFAIGRLDTLLTNTDQPAKHLFWQIFIIFADSQSNRYSYKSSQGSVLALSEVHNTYVDTVIQARYGDDHDQLVSSNVPAFENEGFTLQWHTIIQAFGLGTRPRLLLSNMPTRGTRTQLAINVTWHRQV